ncbi:MAG TPA: biotin--[acetyl-CoA-carboxylase] ligase [Phycisphaerae bacterium]|nr:biotin--[acetyl-CoA-carboxylase] ligase [Phycisphaerae bacterium]
MPQPLDATQICQALPVRRVGRFVRAVPEASSTNDLAFAQAADPRHDGLAIFADYQTAGRGRIGRRWLAPRGAAVLGSVLLFEHDDPARQGRLVLIAGMAVCRAVTAVADDVEPVIRWPNDVLVGGCKLAGILVESKPLPQQRAYVVGIGINCHQTPGHFPPELRDHATSLEIASSHAVARLDLARHLLIELDRYLAPGDVLSDSQLCDRWLAHAQPMGQRVHLQEGGRTYVGRTLQIDPTGSLTIELEPGGRRVFDAATTTVLPFPWRPG